MTEKIWKVAVVGCGSFANGQYFPNISKEELIEKLIEEVINYLDDEDNPYGTEKVWKYLNS